MPPRASFSWESETRITRRSTSSTPVVCPTGEIGICLMRTDCASTLKGVVNLVSGYRVRSVKKDVDPAFPEWYRRVSPRCMPGSRADDVTVPELSCLCQSVARRLRPGSEEAQEEIWQRDPVTQGWHQRALGLSSGGGDGMVRATGRHDGHRGVTSGEEVEGLWPRSSFPSLLSEESCLERHGIRQAAALCWKRCRQQPTFKVSGYAGRLQTLPRMSCP